MNLTRAQEQVEADLGDRYGSVKVGPALNGGLPGQAWMVCEDEGVRVRHRVTRLGRVIEVERFNYNGAVGMPPTP